MIIADLRDRWRRRREERAYLRGTYGQPPPRAALILCNPRSGSTWLFDALRCHPSIEVHERYTLFAALSCLGRRYPRDLASQAEDARQIEVAPGVWDGLPALDLPPLAAPEDGRAPPPTFALEKLHPQFFHYGAAGLLRRLALLDRVSEVRMIYLFRDPEASLTSFLRYKERKPDWFPYIAPDQVPRLLRRTYQTMATVARSRPGLVLEYGDLAERFPTTLTAVFHYLWPAADAAESQALAIRIADATARTRRQPTASAFLGQQAGAVRTGDDAYRDLLTRKRQDLAACRHACAELRRLGAPGLDAA